jgi:hypothetical protein
MGWGNPIQEVFKLVIHGDTSTRPRKGGWAFFIKLGLAIDGQGRS